eukprot:CAMPEP_0118686680 /NCGR_PEP_ID=MMETSP0800-20121206/7951_1 /TAXON_ID=210618 ORGANISM="Striatella unipunctata, Strain CCMP2910" /NCGR_SAMPLE_ID=MMETSP0800 /ASSEMBLY_ACC=CAM_ASM_000638 /LENGTH=125 /DNA_ID=CAMNT_0006583759 /DNA_START=131 /DNA_END=508 /DNA_ORIENTATION=-
MVQNFENEWTFPAGGRSRLLFQSGRAIAKKETAEEAGIIISEARDLVCSVVQPPVLSSRFAAYCCIMDSSSNNQIPNPNNSNGEIQQAAFLTAENITNLADEELRFPDQRQLLLDVIDGVYDASC